MQCDRGAVRPQTTATRRVRIVIALAVAGAVTLMCGLLLVVIGLALQTLAKHPDQHVIGLGAEMAVAGFSFGMIVLAILVLLRGGIGAAATRVRQFRSADAEADARSAPTDLSGPARRASASFASPGRDAR